MSGAVPEHSREEGGKDLPVLAVAPTAHPLAFSVASEIEVALAHDAVGEALSPFENLDLSRIFEELLEEGVRETLDAFVSEEALSHQEAHKVIVDMFADRFAGKELNVDTLLEGVASGAFYSLSSKGVSGEAPQSVKERHYYIKSGVEELATASFNASCDDPNSPHFFTKVPGYGKNGFSAQTAASCPREIVGLEEFGVVEGDSSEFLRYRLFFFELWHKAMEAFKNSGEGACHREAYTMAQITADETLSQFKEDRSDWATIPPKGRKVPAPSLKLFSEEKFEGPAGVDQVDSYIKANLSLIFPDKKEGGLVKENGEFENLIQEEFAIFDLIALSDKFNLYGKYQKIFDAIFAYRRAQFTVNFHFNPEATNHPDPKKVSLVQIFKDFYDRTGKLAYVGDWGEGRGQVGKLLLKMGVVSGVYGVDIDHDSESDGSHTSEDGRRISDKIGVKDRDEEEVLEEIVKRFPKVDVLLACDVVHECSDPTKYIARLQERVNPGGIIYFTDPHHCEAVDRVTSATVYKFDSSHYQTSMIPLEKWFDVDAYLSIMGWRVQGVHIVPGVAAGFNDPFWRGKHILRKLKPGERSPSLYSVPKSPREVIEGDVPIVEVEDCFKVWPLTLIPADSQERVFEELSVYFEAIREESADSKKAPLCLANLRRVFLRALASKSHNSGEVLVGDKDLKGQLKYQRRDRLAYYGKVARMFGDSVEMGRRGAVRESIYLVELLRDHLGVDLINEVRKTPGWESFELPRSSEKFQGENA